MRSSVSTKVKNAIWSLVVLAALATLIWHLANDQDFQKTLVTAGRTSLWILAPGMIFIVGLRWWQQFQPPKIYLFYNATGEQDKQAYYDAVAHNMAVLLQLEFLRIKELLYIPEAIAVQHPAYKKNQVPRPPVPSKTAFSPTETKGGGLGLETLKGMGPLALGPVKVPLGGVLYFIAQALQGPGITGSIQKYGANLSVIAAFEGSKWKVTSDNLSPEAQSEDRLVQELARRLAYMMYADIEGHPSWSSFREVVEGLEHYQRFLRSGRQNTYTLQKAQQHFELATVIDSQFALAWYTLGVAYEAQNKDDAALETYKLARQLKPDYSEAYFGVGKIYARQESIKMAVQAYELGINHAEKAKKKVPAARVSLGTWLVDLAIQEGPHSEDAVKNCKTSIRQLHIADKVYRRLARKASKPDISIHQQNLLYGREQTLKELTRAYRELAQLLAGHEVQQYEPGRADRIVRIIRRFLSWRAGNKIENVLEKRLKMSPNSSETYADLIGFYASRKQYEKVDHYIEMAERVSPEDSTVAFSISESFLNEAVTNVQGLIALRQEQPETWREQVGQKQLESIKSLLDFAMVYYENVIRAASKYSEYEWEREDMVRALNGLATATGTTGLLMSLLPQEFIIEGEMTDDTKAGGQDRIDYAKALLGKALAIYPLSIDTYDNLLGIYEIEKNLLKDLEGNDIETHEKLAIVRARCQDYNIVLDDVISEVWPLPLLDGVEASLESQIYLWCGGWTLIHWGMPEEGIDFLEKARQMGKFHEAKLVNYDIGGVYQKLQRWEQAIQHYSQVDKTDLHYWQSQIGLAESFMVTEEEGKKTAGAAVQEEQKDISQKMLEDSLESIPQQPFTSEQAYQNAIDVAENDPYRRAVTLAGRAELRRTQKKYIAAVHDCQEAMNLVAGYIYPYVVMASVYRDLKDFDRAIEYWKRMEDLSPYQDLSLCHDGLGYAYFGKTFVTSDPEEAKEWMEKAAEEYRRAIRLFEWEEGTDQAETYVNLGKSLVELKCYKEAEAIYLTALELQANSADAFETHFNLAYVYVMQQLFTDACTQYQKAINLCEQQMQQAMKNKNHADFVKYAGGLALVCNDLAYYLHAELNVKLVEGLSLVNRALEIVHDVNFNEDLKRSDMGAYLDTRGWIYYKMGNYEEAQRDLEQAIELTMGTAAEHGHLALVYEKKAKCSQDESDRREWKEKAGVQWQLAIDQERDGTWQKVASQYQSE